MSSDITLQTDMPIKNGVYQYSNYGKSKVVNNINHIYIENNKYLEYDIEYRYLYSPLRTFFGQSKSINGEIYICSCMKQSIENFLKIKSNYGNYMSQCSTPLDVEFFPLETAKMSILVYNDPMKAIKFKDSICPRCKGVIIGPKSPIFSLYVDQYIFSNGISFFHNKYIDECPEEFKAVIDKFNLKNDYFQKLFNVPGKRSSEIYSTFSENDKIELYHNTKEMYHFMKKFESDIRVRLGFKPIGGALVSETTLFKILDKYFHMYTIFKHYHPPFLKGLEIDYFVKELKIGIEYQGKQHFEPIEHFGGKEKYEVQKRNDNKKKEYCDMNNIKLIYINYYDELEETNIISIIKDNIDLTIASSR